MELSAFNWRSLLLKDRAIKPNAKYLALYLATFMNDHNDMAWPSLSRMQWETGLAKNTIIKYLGELNDAGWLLTKRQTMQVQTLGGQQACNQYWITVPERVVQEAIPLPKGGSFDDKRGFISEQKGGRQMNPNNNSNNNNNNNMRFDEFWSLYPKKVDKKKASTAWGRLTESQQDAAISDIKTRYSDTDKRFIPNPTTYIHGERWEDERLDEIDDDLRGAI